MKFTPAMMSRKLLWTGKHMQLGIIRNLFKEPAQLADKRNGY
jgi:hypothetical protein